MDSPVKNYYVHWPQNTVNAERQWYPKLSEDIESTQKEGTEPSDLHEHKEIYWNNAGYHDADRLLSEAGQKALSMSLHGSSTDTRLPAITDK